MRRAEKGFFGMLRRAAVLPRRYGVSADKMCDRLRGMIDTLHRLEITPTIPITARILERHPDLRSELGAVDPAVHGYRHVAYARMSPSEQGRDLDAALRVFASHGLSARGFRAPYLRANEATRQLLRERGFLYDSSAASFALPNDDPVATEARRLAGVRYGDVQSGPSMQAFHEGLVELPVSLPDDELLVDGLGISSPEAIARIFGRLVDVANSRGSLLVLQVHPERFPLFADAITRVVRRATDLGAWRASLSEIAKRTVQGNYRSGSPFTIAITGDLDAVSLGDFASRLWRG